MMIMIMILMRVIIIINMMMNIKLAITGVAFSGPIILVRNRNAKLVSGYVCP